MMKCALLVSVLAFANAAPGLIGQKFKGYYNDNMAHFTPANAMGSSFTTSRIQRGDEGSHYSYKWQGTFTPKQAGRYCFKTNSDDASHVYINAINVVNNGKAHGMKSVTGCANYQAKSYGIAITFGERSGGAAMYFDWMGGSQKSFTRSLGSTFTTGTTEPAFPTGRLVAQKYNGYWADKLSHFTTARKTGATFTTFEINRGDEGSMYSYKWMGYFTPKTSGKYCFWTSSDDASAVYIKNAMVVNNLGLHGRTARSGCATYAAGVTNPIQIYFGENKGGASMQFKYQIPGSGAWNTAIDAQFTVAKPNTWQSCTHMACHVQAGKHCALKTHPGEKKHRCGANGPHLDEAHHRAFPYFQSSGKHLPTRIVVTHKGTEQHGTEHKCVNKNNKCSCLCRKGY